MTRKRQPENTPMPGNPRFLVPLAAMLIITALFAALPTTGNPHADEPTLGWPTPAGWPEYGGNHHRTGASPATGPTSNAHAPGTSAFTLNDRSFSGPVIDHEGNVYVGDIGGFVTKLSPKLEKLWTSPALGGELRSSVLVAPDGHVYAAPAANEQENEAGDGSLFALDAATGDVEWFYDVGNMAETRSEYVLTAAPVYHPDGYILQGSMDGHLYAITLDGELLWRFATHDDIDNKVVSTPAISDDGTIYFGSQNGRLYALGPDGQPRWHHQATEEASGSGDDVEQLVAAPSIGPDGTVYFGTRHKNEAAGVVYAMEDQGENVKEKWTRVLNEKVVAPVTVRDDGALFIGALDGTFYRLDAADGSIKWTFNPIDDDPSIQTLIFAVLQAAGSPSLLTVAEQAVVAANKHVYVSYWNVDITQGFPPEHSNDSPVYALDTEDGSIEWRRVYDHTKRAPAMLPTTTKDDAGNARGVLYVSGDDGKVHAIAGVTPNPVPLPTPGTPEDEPEADPDDNTTIQPGTDPGNETDDAQSDPQNNENQPSGNATDPTQADNDNPLEQIPAPGIGALLLVLLAPLGLLRRWHQRRAYA